MQMNPNDSTTTAKFSREMRASLDNMRSFLKCHICNNDMENPATLHCGHSFCFDCISEHSTQPGKKGFDCPVFGCGQSITAGKTAGKKSSIAPNATMAQIMQGLNSLEEKCSSAPDFWYKRQGKTREGGAAASGDGKAQEDDVFTFQMERRNDRPGDNGSVGESSHSTVSSTSTKPYVCPTGTTMSIDQSIFSTKNAQDISKRESEPTPGFSSSPIPMSSDETQTASQLEKVLAGVNKDGAAAEPDEKQPAVKSTATKGGVHDDCGKRNSSSDGNASKDDDQEKKQPADPRRGNGKKRARDYEKDEEMDGEKPTSKSPRRPRVSFQPQPQVMLLNSSLSLSSKDSRSLRKLKAVGMISILRLDQDICDEFDSGLNFDAEIGRDLFLTTLSSDRTNNSVSVPLRFYGIGTEKDEEFSMAADGVVVKRSFLFYVAVACGLAMVDIAFVTDMANIKRNGNQSHSKYLHPSSLGTKKRNRSVKKDDSSAHRIIGGSNYNWYAPQRAYENAVKRHAEWLNKEGEEAADSVLLPGTDLLDQYSILLLGEYDPANHSKRTAAKRKKQQQHGERQDYCTKGNVTLLLQLCGARVYDVGAVASSKCIKKGLGDKLEALKAITPLRSSHGKSPRLADMLATAGDKTLIVVNDRPSAKLGKEVLTAINGDPKVPIVSCNWLLDSIGDFEVKQTAEYTLET